MVLDYIIGFVVGLTIGIIVAVKLVVRFYYAGSIKADVDGSYYIEQECNDLIEKRYALFKIDLPQR